MGLAVITNVSDPVEDLSNRSNKLNSSPDLQGFPDRLTRFSGQPFKANFFEYYALRERLQTDIRDTAQILRRVLALCHSNSGVFQV